MDMNNRQEDSMIPKYAVLLLAAAGIIGTYAGLGYGKDGGTSQTTPPTSDPAAGENHVAGIDANANAVRDDLEAFIATNFSAPTQRDAAQEFASVMQSAMTVDKADVAAVKAISERSSHAVDDIYVKFNGTSADRQPSDVVEEVVSISTNTNARLLAYQAYLTALRGPPDPHAHLNCCQ
jgi:hypothetical protein